MIRFLSLAFLLLIFLNTNYSLAQNIDSICPDCIEDPDFYAEFKNKKYTEKEWIRKHIIYPENYSPEEMGDGVEMTLIIEKDGTISSIIIDPPVHEELEKEVRRLINSMPKWIPAKHNGQKVRQRRLYDIWFNTA